MKDLNFIALDVETANTDYSSICQIGLAFFEGGNLVKKESHLINPEVPFHGYNIGVHGINPIDVAGKPTFIDFYDELCSKILGNVIVHHQPFDFCAMRQAVELHGLEFPHTYWLDNAAVVRRTWEQFRYKGYGLKNVAKHLGIEFKHHDACEDAVAAGLIFIEACKLTGNDIEKWAEEVEKKRFTERSERPSPQKLSGDLLVQELTDDMDPNNPFYNKKVVISGVYATWPDRKDLAILLKSFGADIDTSVGAKTNILCAGGGVGPSKLKKMEKNIQEGKDAIILYEPDIIEILIELQCNKN